MTSNTSSRAATAKLPSGGRIASPAPAVALSILNPSSLLLSSTVAASSFSSGGAGNLAATAAAQQSTASASSLRNPLRPSSSVAFNEKYEVLERIGKGSFSTVWKVKLRTPAPTPNALLTDKDKEVREGRRSSKHASANEDQKYHRHHDTAAPASFLSQDEADSSSVHEVSVCADSCDKASQLLSHNQQHTSRYGEHQATAADSIAAATTTLADCASPSVDSASMFAAGREHAAAADQRTASAGHTHHNQLSPPSSASSCFRKRGSNTPSTALGTAAAAAPSSSQLAVPKMMMMSSQPPHAAAQPQTPSLPQEVVNGSCSDEGRQPVDSSTDIVPCESPRIPHKVMANGSGDVGVDFAKAATAPRYFAAKFISIESATAGNASKPQTPLGSGGSGGGGVTSSLSADGAMTKLLPTQQQQLSSAFTTKAFNAEEADILANLPSHTSTLGLVDVFYSKTECVIVTEYLAGGEVFDYVANTIVVDKDAAENEAKEQHQKQQSSGGQRCLVSDKNDGHGGDSASMRSSLNKALERGTEGFDGHDQIHDDEEADAGDGGAARAAPALLTESAGVTIMADLLSAIAHLHENGVCHRDVKLENMMFVHDPRHESTFSCPVAVAPSSSASSSSSPFHIKLIDYGFSKKIGNTRPLKSCCGSPNYVPPEMLKAARAMENQRQLQQQLKKSSVGGGGLTASSSSPPSNSFLPPPSLSAFHTYGKEVDLWSAGVVLYVLLFGEYPFFDEKKSVWQRKILQGSFVVPNTTRLVAATTQEGGEEHDSMNSVSDRHHQPPPCPPPPAAVDLLKRLLEVDPMKRITAREALNHPWLRGEAVFSDETDGGTSETTGKEEVSGDAPSGLGQHPSVMSSASSNNPSTYAINRQGLKIASARPQIMTGSLHGRRANGDGGAAAHANAVPPLYHTGRSFFTNTAGPQRTRTTSSNGHAGQAVVAAAAAAQQIGGATAAMDGVGNGGSYPQQKRRPSQEFFGAVMGNGKNGVPFAATNGSVPAPTEPENVGSRLSFSSLPLTPSTTAAHAAAATADRLQIDRSRQDAADGVVRGSNSPATSPSANLGKKKRNSFSSSLTVAAAATSAANASSAATGCGRGVSKGAAVYDEANVNTTLGKNAAAAEATATTCPSPNARQHHQQRTQHCMLPPPSSDNRATDEDRDGGMGHPAHTAPPLSVNALGSKPLSPPTNTTSGLGAAVGGVGAHQSPTIMNGRRRNMSAYVSSSSAAASAVASVPALVGGAPATAASIAAAVAGRTTSGIRSVAYSAAASTAVGGVGGGAPATANGLLTPRSQTTLLHMGRGGGGGTIGSLRGVSETRQPFGGVAALQQQPFEAFHHPPEALLAGGSAIAIAGRMPSMTTANQKLNRQWAGEPLPVSEKSEQNAVVPTANCFSERSGDEGAEAMRTVVETGECTSELFDSFEADGCSSPPPLHLSPAGPFSGSATRTLRNLSSAGRGGSASQRSDRKNSANAVRSSESPNAADGIGGPLFDTPSAALHVAPRAGRRAVGPAASSSAPRAGEPPNAVGGGFRGDNHDSGFTPPRNSFFFSPSAAASPSPAKF